MTWELVAQISVLITVTTLALIAIIQASNNSRSNQPCSTEPPKSSGRTE